MTMKYVIPLFIAALVLSACGQREEPMAPTGNQATATPSTPPVPSDPVNTATVRLLPTQGSSVTGMLTFTSFGSMLTLSGNVEGLPPNGAFGFHIHETGDCSAPDASSAGGHFNPTHAQHGNPVGENHHAGDMKNLRSGPEGRAQINAQVEEVTLGSGEPNDVAGRAVVVHQMADDYETQPAGDSGARIACGVITTTAM